MQRDQIAAVRLLVSASMQLPIAARQDATRSEFETGSLSEFVRRTQPVVAVRHHSLQNEHATGRAAMIVDRTLLAAPPTDHVDLEDRGLINRLKAELVGIERDVRLPLIGNKQDPGHQLTEFRLGQ